LKSSNLSFELENVYVAREKDWRNGTIVYQVFVDRFAPSDNLSTRKDKYPYPKTLREWSDLPKPGPYDEKTRYCTHELEYWGGNLQSLLSKLDYIKSLGIDVLYLNPIHKSLSNHKYDASDYMQISPEYGTFEDLNSLSEALHNSGKKLMLDGVFNHVGITSELFQKALDPKSKFHNWFDFDNKYPEGVRLWADVRSLPELNLENPEVQNYIYRNNDSVIRTYLKNGTDGWRLDVAFDIGFKYLKEITEASHEEKPQSMIVGEIWNYPQDWLKSIDGVMNFTFREIITSSIKGEIGINMTNMAFKKVIEDTGIEGILKSWNVLDNHDTPRLINLLPNELDQRLAQILQFTLPGSPNLYYGTELGMTGANDPMNRAPMRWDLVYPENTHLKWTKGLIGLHNKERALKIGDYLPLITDDVIAFERKTDKVSDTIIVLVNPTDTKVSASVLVPDSKLMNYSNFDILLGQHTKVSLMAGIIKTEMEPKSFLILKPITKPIKSYSAYKRV